MPAILRPWNYDYVKKSLAERPKRSESPDQRRLANRVFDGVFTGILPQIAPPERKPVSKSAPAPAAVPVDAIVALRRQLDRLFGAEEVSKSAAAPDPFREIEEMVRQQQAANAPTPKITLSKAAQLSPELARIAVSVAAKDAKDDKNFELKKALSPLFR